MSDGVQPPTSIVIRSPATGHAPIPEPNERPNDRLGRMLIAHDDVLKARPRGRKRVVAFILILVIPIGFLLPGGGDWMWREKVSGLCCFSMTMGIVPLAIAGYEELAWLRKAVPIKSDILTEAGQEVWRVPVQLAPLGIGACGLGVVFLGLGHGWWALVMFCIPLVCVGIFVEQVHRLDKQLEVVKEQRSA